MSTLKTRRFDPVDVGVDSTGWYIVFADSAEGSADMRQCFSQLNILIFALPVIPRCIHLLQPCGAECQKEQVSRPHLDPEIGLQRPRAYEYLGLEDRPKHPRVSGQLSQEKMESWLSLRQRNSISRGRASTSPESLSPELSSQQRSSSPTISANSN